MIISYSHVVFILVFGEGTCPKHAKNYLENLFMP